MYKCFDCGCVFEQPKTYVEDCTPGGVSEGGSFLQKYDCCPECEGAFGSVEECVACGEWEYLACGEFTSMGFVCCECSNAGVDELEMGDLENE